MQITAVWFGPGLNNCVTVMSLDGVGRKGGGWSTMDQLQKIELFNSFLAEPRNCEQAFVSARLLCDFFFFFLSPFLLFTSTVQKLQALSQYTLSKVFKAAGSKCRISVKYN